ncbi:MAG TPA: hypothetical protein VNX25_07850 [Verrucomicrobiae bacterium]|nr:hypothetical protein [Verrucomicrobiae bacterium]
MPGKKKKDWLKSNIGQFMKEYGRKCQRGVEPNDRQYDRKVEKLIKQMDPAELNELLNDEVEPEINGEGTDKAGNKHRK